MSESGLERQKRLLEEAEERLAEVANQTETKSPNFHALWDALVKIRGILYWYKEKR